MTAAWFAQSIRGAPVTWQDELRQLDEELAAGRLSAEDYRRQRDELLSQSASTAAPAHTPVHQQPASGPFPPPFRWDQSPSESTQYLSPIRDEPTHGAEPTQVVSGRTAAGDDAERTQVVSGHAGQVPRAGDADRTQVVPGQHGLQGPPSPPIGFPNQQQPPLNQPPPVFGQGPGPGQAQSVPPWQQQAPANSPPWGGSDLPPTTDLPPAWLRQGPEVFESAGNSNTGKIVAGVVAVVVVAALGVGAFFVFRPDGNTTATNTTSAPAPTTTAAPTTTEPPEPIVRPPGSVQIDDSYTLARLREAQLLSTEDFTIVEANKVSEAQVAVTKQGELTLGTWAFQVASTATGETMLTQIDQLYTGVAFKPAEGITREKVSVLVLAPQPGQPGIAVYRAHYLGEDDKVVRVEAYGPDATTARTAFVALLDQQLKQLPPS